MNKLSLLTIAVSVFLASCGGGKKEDDKQVKEAKGGVVYGGVFRMNEVEDFRSLFPLNLTEVQGYRITNQIYEGLVRFNQADLTVVPGIAEKWDINEDATKFTFYLRKGVKFHDDPCFADGKGREVKAADFKYCMDMLCTAFQDNQMFWLVQDRLKGANEYYQSTVAKAPLAGGVAGVRVIDEYTVELELNYSFAGFINIIGHNGCWIYPKEALEKYGTDMRTKCVGTGPFVIKTVKEGEAVILEKNANYWKFDQFGNQLPYLDALKYTFMKEKKTELMEFRKGNLDMVFKLPLEMINDVAVELEDAKRGGNKPFEMQNTPAFSVQYYGFQHKSELFSNKNVRLAFNHAIDRSALETYTLQGDGMAAEWGIIPKGFKKYNYDSLKGFTFDPAMAKQFLSDAGYPNGKGFPEITLQLNSGGSINTQVAEAIQKMLMENLNISVKLEVLPFAQHLDNVETGKTIFFRTAWVSDYPDPESFLTLLYGKTVPEKLEEKSYLNSVRYQNPEFDKVFEQALQEVDEEKRFRLYRKADQIQMDDAAIMPIYYDEYTRLLQANVKNFPANAMEVRDFSEVYFKD